jgi:hypothetical protein
MEPMFDITRGEENVREGPKITEEFVRGQGCLSLVAAGGARGTLDPTGGYLRFPNDAVLLMTGTTNDLLGAFEEAFNGGILMIGTEDDRVLKLLCARVKVLALNQTDTLIAIGADQGWLPAPQRDQWRGVTAKNDITYVTTRTQNEVPTRALPDMISEIKRTMDSSWIDAYS